MVFNLFFPFYLVEVLAERPDLKNLGGYIIFSKHLLHVINQCFFEEAKNKNKNNWSAQLHEVWLGECYAGRAQLVCAHQSS